MSQWQLADGTEPSLRCNVCGEPTPITVHGACLDCQDTAQRLDKCGPSASRFQGTGYGTSRHDASPITFDPMNPAHDPAYQLQLLGNGISRAAALLRVNHRGDRTMEMPEWVLRQWLGNVTLVAKALASVDTLPKGRDGEAGAARSAAKGDAQP